MTSCFVELFAPFTALQDWYGRLLIDSFSFGIFVFFVATSQGTKSSVSICVHLWLISFVFLLSGRGRGESKDGNASWGLTHRGPRGAQKNAARQGPSLHPAVPCRAAQETECKKT